MGHETTAVHHCSNSQKQPRESVAKLGRGAFDTDSKHVKKNVFLPQVSEETIEKKRRPEIEENTFSKKSTFFLKKHKSIFFSRASRAIF